LLCAESGHLRGSALRQPQAHLVARDGGDITFHGFNQGVVYLAMKGSCSGCPSSVATLKNGIENLLRHYIPEVVEVRAVR
jgi:Fe-S cluster biogenesis protein NfuA